MSVSLDRFPIRRIALFVTLTLLGVLLGLQAAPLRSTPQLSVREQDGQLRIAWGRIADSAGGRLEIIDGGSSANIPVNAHLSGLTYAPRTGDVQVRLITGARQQAVHFVGGAQANAAQLSKQMKDLTVEVRRIRMATERGLRRVSQIQSDADRLLASLDDAGR
jgi:hypothetical protein